MNALRRRSDLRAGRTRATGPRGSFRWTVSRSKGQGQSVGPVLRTVPNAGRGVCWYTARRLVWGVAGSLRGGIGGPDRWVGVSELRSRLDSLFADRGYDHDIYRCQVHDRGIVPAITRRGTRHGTGLGTYRWVVERTFAWVHGFRRLRIRWERRADIHEAFLNLACCLITYRQLGVLCRP